MLRSVAVAVVSCIFNILGAAPSGASDDGTIIVVTSFPEELTTRYEREFE
jgi:phosphoglycerate transport regulatory protein PgtC